MAPDERKEDCKKGLEMYVMALARRTRGHLIGDSYT
jgi:hypothetical protein